MRWSYVVVGTAFTLAADIWAAGPGAEIEIDGVFVGNTPRISQVSPGEQTDADFEPLRHVGKLIRTWRPEEFFRSLSADEAENLGVFLEADVEKVNEEQRFIVLTAERAVEFRPGDAG